MNDILIALEAAPLTYALIVINLVISLYALGNQRFMETYIFNMGAAIKDKQYYRGLSSAFLHADGMHLFFNMYVLFNFGPLIERIYGTFNFALIYLGAQATAMLASYLNNKNNMAYQSLGASGAISGIVLAFAVVAPMAGMGIIFLPFFIPAFLFAPLYIGISIFLMKNNVGNIAHDAHIGGAVGGAVLAAVLGPDLIGAYG